MTIQDYLQRRKECTDSQAKYRDFCLTCRQPGFSCYCEGIEVFDPGVKFVILNHPIEMRRRIATGRMSHLCLKDSELIVGHDYTLNSRVNEIISDPTLHSVILYPGQSSTNLTQIPKLERTSLFPKDKKLAIFVIDGTWATARQTASRSQNLKALPRICFTPPAPSTFRVRKQPSKFCYSTIEAIHHCLDLLAPVRLAELDSSSSSPLASESSRQHDILIRLFNRMVERQLEIKAARNLIRAS